MREIGETEGLLDLRDLFDRILEAVPAESLALGDARSGSSGK
jgi:hypothetical protein